MNEKPIWSAGSLLEVPLSRTRVRTSKPAGSMTSTRHCVMTPLIHASLQVTARQSTTGVEAVAVGEPVAVLAGHVAVGPNRPLDRASIHRSWECCCEGSSRVGESVHSLSQSQATHSLQRTITCVMSSPGRRPFSTALPRAG
jgi:hypothetical protein